jgi:hypothetical protein
MRVFLTTAVLVGAGLLWYAPSSGRVAAQGGQFVQAGIVSGEKVRLFFDPDRSSYECTVIEVRGDFVGCRASGDTTFQSRPDRWYNLRVITRIDRPIKQE